MGQTSDTVHIFHLYRKDGTAVFLHPFRRTDRFHQLLTQNLVVGHYGRDPRVESLTLFKNELYRVAEQEVKEWVSDRQFTPRFILAGAAFLVCYLFMSFVVRDPIPILDELAVSLGVSILTYILLGRRDMKSDVAMKRRIALRSAVDGIVFSESEFVAGMEKALGATEAHDAEALVSSVLEVESTLGIEGHEKEATQLVSYLELLLANSDYKRTEKRIRKISQAPQSGGRNTLRKWFESNNVDGPMFALYMQLSRKVKSRSE